MVRPDLYIFELAEGEQSELVDPGVFFSVIPGRTANGLRSCILAFSNAAEHPLGVGSIEVTKCVHAANCARLNECLSLVLIVDAGICKRFPYLSDLILCNDHGTDRALNFWCVNFKERVAHQTSVSFWAAAASGRPKYGRPARSDKRLE